MDSPVLGGDLARAFHACVSPEAIRHARRDHQRVEILSPGTPVGTSHLNAATRQIGGEDLSVDGPGSVQPPEPVERDPVVSLPFSGPCDASAQLLPTDQRRFRRDADDVDMAGQSDRGEDAAVAETCDHDSPPRPVLPNQFSVDRGGRGTSRETRWMTSE